MKDELENSNNAPVDAVPENEPTAEYSPVSAPETAPYEPVSEAPAEVPVIETSTTPVVEAFPTEPVTPVVVTTDSIPTNSPFTASDPGISADLPPVAPKKKNKGLLIGIITASVLIVLGGGSALAYNMWYQNSDKVVSDALVNAITAKTVGMTGTAVIEQTDDYVLNLKVDSKVNGAAGEIAAVLTYKADEFEYKIDGAGYYSVDGDIYLKFNNVRALADAFSEQSNGKFNTAPFDDIIAKIEGKWLKVSNEDIGELSEEYKKSQLCFDDARKSLTDNRAVTDEVAKLYKANKFIVADNSLGSKTINGVGSLGYVITADKEKGDAFFTGLADTQIGKKLKECDATIDFSTIIDNATEDAADESAKTNVELWVSRFGHEITELKIDGSDDESKSNFVLNPVFNKEYSLEAPKDAMPLEELQTEIQQAYITYYMEQAAASN